MKLAYDFYQPPKENENKGFAPIIFLHGGNDSRKTWTEIAEEVTKETGREAYAYDVRNHGESPWSNDMHLDDLVGDLEEFMNDHLIPRAILIGHSLGGRIAIAFTLKKPEAVEKIIVEDTGVRSYSAITTKVLLENVTMLRESLKSVPPNSTEEEAKQAIVDFLMKNLPPAQPDGTQKAIYDLNTVPIKKEGDKFVFQNNIDVIEDMIRLGKNNKPYSGVYNGDALFIYGTNSFVRLKADTELYKYFPRLIKLPVEGVGHLIHQVCPEKFSKLIIDFILQQEERYF